MKKTLFENILPLLFALTAATAALLWLLAFPGDQIQARIKLREPHPRASARKADEPYVPIEAAGELQTLDGTPAPQLAGAWPCFRNTNLNATAVTGAELARKWPERGPHKLWEREAGEGYAGAAVLDGRVYILDYDRQNQCDVLRCLSLADGRDIWRFSYPVKVKRNHGMSRTVPAVTEKYVVSLGPKCHVVCLDSKTGKFRWAIDMVRRWNAEVPPWYAGQCPIIRDGQVILAPGGDHLLVSVDCETGEVVWKTSNPHNWRMTHSSISTMKAAGEEMYVYCASGGVAGVSTGKGEILWTTDSWKINIATVPSPVPVGEGRLFLTGGYNAGSMMLKVAKQEGEFKTEPLFEIKPKVFACEQQTPILLQDHLYGVRYDGQLACLDLDGKLVWKSGSTRRFGLGPFSLAEGMLYVVNDTGSLFMVEATPEGYNQLNEAKILDTHDAWGPIAIAGKRLIMRGFKRMVCLNIGEQASGEGSQ